MAGDTRPDPDQLLADVQRDEARAKRGRLRIFFGASAGVGKTFSMLEAARTARAAGTDIVVGYIEPHGRPETERLLEGLEQLPTVAVRYRGVTRREFDLDATLRRRAAITLVDELAHTNLIEGIPAPRHAKRWQDIEEMLEAGLDVWTTLNVQHVESLNDVIASITGVRQQETVPDRVLEDASEIELIDLPPEELLERLRTGKVYFPEHVGAALDRFFRKPNLLALRELALRQTADRVDAAARAYAGPDRGSRPWLARERFLIGVGPDDQGEELVRFGKRFADALDAEWIVVAVETPPLLRLGEAERNRRIEVLRLAESLGAEAVTLDGPTAASVLLQYARTRNVTRIVVGEPKQRGLRALWRRSTVQGLLAHAHGIDVSVIARREPARVDRQDRPLQDPILAGVGLALGGAEEERQDDIAGPGHGLGQLLGLLQGCLSVSLHQPATLIMRYHHRVGKEIGSVDMICMGVGVYDIVDLCSTLSHEVTNLSRLLWKRQGIHQDGSLIGQDDGRGDFRIQAAGEDVYAL